MIGAGRLDRQITIAQKGAVIGRDGFNNPIYGPDVLLSVRARREDVSDAEKFMAGGVNAITQTRFTIRSSPETRAIAPDDTMTHEGVEWNILGVKETKDARFRFLEITAVRSAD